MGSWELGDVGTIILHPFNYGPIVRYLGAQSPNAGNNVIAGIWRKKKIVIWFSRS